MIENTAAISIKGHVKIVDDLGNVLVDKSNSIHPQNMSRIIARALANEPNSHVWKIVYGNGGTQVGSSLAIDFNHPNDGISPDIRTWNSELYNETYAEIVDDSSPLIGTDPGSPGRPSGGDFHTDDPATIEHVSGPGVRSNELGVQSQVVITSVLNPNEPRGQQNTDTFPGGAFAGPQPSDGEFVFDEIGIYTKGAPHVATSGYQNVDVSTKTADLNSGLVANTTYSFRITVDSGTEQLITFTTPNDSFISYQDLISAINTGSVAYGLSGSPAISGATVQMSGDTFNSQTFGFLSFISQSSGAISTIALRNAQIGDPGSDLFAGLNPPTGSTLLPAVAGSNAGIPNIPTQPSREGERLLAHCIFSPVMKNRNRTLITSYVLTISVARTAFAQQNS